MAVLKILFLLSIQIVYGLRIKSSGSKLKSFDGEKSRSIKDLKTIGLLTAVSAPLGVVLDNQHGFFDVLNYHCLNMNLYIGDTLIVKSAYWVPFLFALAGAIMSYIQLVVDRKLGVVKTDLKLSGPRVLYGISAFSGLYYLSGLLDALLWDPLQINLCLSIIAIAGFIYFDGSVSGLVLAIVTAISGPVAEIFLINQGLYDYAHADILNIASWIPAVYFLGGPAVGNLTRFCYYSMEGDGDGEG